MTDSGGGDGAPQRADAGPSLFARCLFIVGCALAFGLASGFTGAAIHHHVEATYGAGQGAHRRQLELLTLPSLPGQILAQRGRPDLRVDEAWDFRWQVTFWNALAWGILGIVVAPVIALGMTVGHRPQR